MRRVKNWDDIFEGKKITVVGLGLLGRGVGDVAFLARHGADIIVTDLKTEEELAVSVEQLREFSNITFVFGEHRMEDFQNRDFIVKGPVVPSDSPYILEAKKNGIPIKMSASWFAELAAIPVVGVTGTRGKTTTTYMLHAIMNEAGMHVLLGGNIRGVSTLSLLDTVTKDSVALLELDSWQCWGFGEAKFSPHIAVFSTFMQDHMDYYQNNSARYLEDKAYIFLNQESSDTLVLGEQAYGAVTSAYGKHIQSHVVEASPDTFPKEWELNVLGEHNKANAACALEAARALGIDDEISKKALEAFTGVPSRLELVHEVHGIKFYNDTTATTPDATFVALRALGSEKKNIILIMGGADKGLPVDVLRELIPQYTKKVIYLAGSGTEKLGVGESHQTLESAFVEALKEAQEGDIVLLSPAFASFGMFKNEFDRGDQFNALVAKL